MRVGVMAQQSSVASSGVLVTAAPATSGRSGSESGSAGRAAFFLNLFANVRDVAFPSSTAMRTVAIAITSIVSFLPVWKLYYYPGLWFSDLWWWWSSASSKSSSSCGSVVAAAARSALAYNEVNDATVRRYLAQKPAQAIIGDHVGPLYRGFYEPSSQRRICEFMNSKGQTLFTQSWMPGMTTRPAIRAIKGLVILLHGLNEHSGRYANFACQLNDRGYGVYAMDWIGHGGSDGLHGYVESLDQVVLDTKLYLKQVTAEHPNVPVFLFGHSTGGAIALKTSFLASDEKMLRGIVLTSPAVRVEPSHPIVGLFAPLFSILLPRYQFRGATKARQAAVCGDPLALLAKYSDPLVYTGPIRIRTGTEILRLGSFLLKNLEKITTPFLVLHGSRDEVTDPRGSQELFEKAASGNKSIQIYEGLLHDLLFELEKDAIIGDIVRWLDGMLQQHP